MKPHHIYHIYNQGNNRQNIFLYERDYNIFLKLFKKLLLPYCDIIAWCFMPNHFHFMIYTDERVLAKQKQGGLILDPLTNGIRKLLSGYARIFNKINNRSGSLFRQKTKIKCLSDISLTNIVSSHEEYFINCFNYIHQNPHKAKLVKDLAKWKYSSFMDYTGQTKNSICNKQLAEAYCRFNTEDFNVKTLQPLNEEIINLIRP